MIAVRQGRATVRFSANCTQFSRSSDRRSWANLKRNLTSFAFSLPLRRELLRFQSNTDNSEEKTKQKRIFGER